MTQSVALYFILLLAVAIGLVAMVVMVLVAWLMAKAMAAFTVAIGQAQQLALVGVATREEIDMRRGAQRNDDDDEQTRPARVGLLDDFDDRDMRAAARQGERQPRRPKEWNANDNATDGSYTEPETAFDDVRPPA